MPPIRPDEDDLMREAASVDAVGSPALVCESYQSPQGMEFCLVPRVFAGHPCVVADVDGHDGNGDRGLLVVLDGERTLRRVGRLVRSGEIDPRMLPCMVGIDAAEPLRDYTPWWHPAYKQGAPDFGGGAGTFLDGVVLPVLDAARHELGLDADAGRTALFGYSLAGLFCLNALMLTDAFGTYLVASPSTWYPGFVNRLARSAVDVTACVAIACGANEGLDHPEPICGIRQETDRAVAALTERLAVPPSVMIDSRDHHSGFARRLRSLLGWLGEEWQG